MHAYIYARFSTMEQAKGTSLARQLEDCRRHCDRHHWARDETRELTDEGRSAYDGANRAAGSQLAEFENLAMEGALPPNTVLVVERLDRISRQSAADVFQLVARLTDCGVAIATVDGDRLYRKGSFDFASLIELIVKAQLSHEESEKKSQRLSSAWSQKRAKARGGGNYVLTKRCPAWITVDETERCYRLFEERAKIVRYIFSLATSGHGKHLIARKLNVDGVPTWNGGNGWHPSYIQKILTSRATVGEFQPFRKVDGKRVADGDPIPSFFPPAIDEATFARAQADRISRTGLRGRRGKGISNLFAGLGHCSSCGGSMTFRNKGRVGEQYLVCDNGLRKRSCQHAVYFNYPALEAGIIDQTLHLALTDRHLTPSTETKKLEVSLAEQRQRLIEAEERRRRLVHLLSRTEDEEVERQLTGLSAQIATAKSNIAEAEKSLVVARGLLSPQQNILRIRNLMSNMQADDEGVRVSARGTVQQALRSLIHSIEFDPIAGGVSVDLGSSSFVLSRSGKLQDNHDLGATSLLSLRERGWVLKKYRNHPVLGAKYFRTPEPSDDG